MGIVMMILGIALAIGIMLFANKSKKIKIDVATLFIAAVLVSLSLEICTFNYTSYENIGQSLKKSEGSVTMNENGTKSTNKNYSISKVEDSEKPTFNVEVKNINSKVNDILVKPKENVGRVKVSIDYKDEVFTDYSTWSGKDYYVAPGVTSSEYIRVHFAGKTSSIRLRLECDNLGLTSTGFKVGINQNIPFRFNAYRVILVTLFLFALALVYRYRNLNYAGNKSKKVRRIAIASLLIIQILFLFFLANGQKEEDRQFVFENMSEKSVKNLDQYQKLALALKKGQTNLDGLDEFVENSEKEELATLAKIKDPYKPNIRDKETQNKGKAYAWDYAYYDGHYYTYYGPVPVVATFLPVYALTGKILTTRFVTTLFAIIISMLMCLLVHNIAKRRKLNMWAVIGTMAASLSTIFLPSVFNGAKIYELSPLGGLICILAGVNLVYEGVHRKTKNNLFLGLGALAFALAVGCKASFLLASIVILPFILNYLARRGNSKNKHRIIRYFANVFSKENIKTILAMLVPYVVVGVLLMIYNMVRFGSPFDFGVAYQLTVYDTSYFKPTEISKLLVVIQNGLFRLPVTSANFPFIDIPDAEIVYNGYIFAMAGVGVFAFPFIWAFFGVPVTVKNSLKKNIDKAFVVTTAIVALVLCYVTIVMGGPSYRYSLDFGWAFTIPSIFVIFAIEKWARKKKVLRQALIGIFIVVFATVLINTLLAFNTGFNDMDEIRPNIYYDVFHAVMFWR